MHKALTDFRIENDSVVMLAFANGQSYRVSPSDLERHLSEEDLAKVRKALGMRKQFMRRILPPTALFVLATGIIALGAYDAPLITNFIRTHIIKPAPQQQSTPVPAHLSAEPAQPQSATETASPVASPAQVSIPAPVITPHPPVTAQQRLVTSKARKVEQQVPVSFHQEVPKDAQDHAKDVHKKGSDASPAKKPPLPH